MSAIQPSARSSSQVIVDPATRPSTPPILTNIHARIQMPSNAIASNAIASNAIAGSGATASSATACSSSVRWNERIISHLNRIEERIDEIPNYVIQEKLDQIGLYIQSQFAPLTEFNAWLENNGEGEWYTKLSFMLVKLPMQTIRDIILQIYNIIKAILYTAIHPLKSLNHLAKMIVNLIYELTKPENWSKMGVGMLGSCLGQTIITGNPLSILVVIIGAAMLVAGLTFGPLKAAIDAEEGNRFAAFKENLSSQTKEVFDSALMGVCLGLLIGAVSTIFLSSFKRSLARA